MTWRQGLIVKIVMVAVAAGLLFGAGNGEKTDEPEQRVTALPATDAEPAVKAETTDGQEPGEAVGVPSASPPRRAATVPLDLNRAGVEDLAALPALGDILAQRVVAYRARHGAFRSVDELRKVRGIGEKRMAQLRPLVVTNEAP